MSDLQKYLEIKKVNSIIKMEESFENDKYLDIKALKEHTRQFTKYENEVLDRINDKLLSYCLIGKIIHFNYAQHYILDVKIEVKGLVFLQLINTKNFKESGKCITWEQFRKMLDTFNCQDELDTIKITNDIRIPYPMNKIDN